MRHLLPLLVVAALAPLAACAPAGAADLRDPGAITFPFAGGGTVAAAEGVDAGKATLAVRDVEGLLDGRTLVVIDPPSRRAPTNLLAIGPDGVMHGVTSRAGAASPPSRSRRTARS